MGKTVTTLLLIQITFPPPQIASRIHRAPSLYHLHTPTTASPPGRASTSISALSGHQNKVQHQAHPLQCPLPLFRLASPRRDTLPAKNTQNMLISGLPTGCCVH
ncbi:hypothetical protein BDN72DRAFT_846664 [Pluteus cervinus]|uniref:Uncharacterized protein n=1 Tax=Pluteus cervinus TaxID=181527 RepID=A0ACD3AG56_9AGAR|nr:hypothetical protein BDN72DRAFT_846664 [Pluteus cervinus]